MGTIDLETYRIALETARALGHHKRAKRIAWLACKLHPRRRWRWLDRRRRAQR